MQPSSRPRRLVTSEHCHVEQCSEAGTVHVRFGDLTLRLRPNDFVELATALRLAANRLETSGAEPLTTIRLLC